MYQWSVNGKKINNKQLEFYSEADAHKDAELHKPLAKTKDKVQLEVNSEYRQRPAETIQMRMVLFEIMKRLIDDHKYCNCEGCNLSPPASGQKAHMEMGGCMDEGMNFAEQYIRQSWAIVESNDLVAVYNNVCLFLEISPQGLSLLAKAVLEWICPDTIVVVINYSNNLVVNEPPDIDSMLAHVNSPLLTVV